MADADVTFDYVAVDSSGRKVKGAVSAPNDSAAFDRLKRDGLSPLKIRRGVRDRQVSRTRAGRLDDRELAALLSDLAALIAAGADMRTAFAILGTRSAKGVRSTVRSLSADVGGGENLERAFSKHLPPRLDFVAALIAAGEASGNLSVGFERAAEMLSSRLKLTDQFVSIIAYPAFVFASTLAALCVILFFVIPSLAPLIEDSTSPPPTFLAAMVGFSAFFTDNAGALLVGGGLLALALVAATWADLLRGPIEILLLDGPTRRTASAIVYGGFAISLGTMLGGGAPIGEALRLAVRSVSMARARSRLEPVGAAVRQGASLANALEAVQAFPPSIARLAAVGEATGALGVSIARAGRLEEERALRRLEQAGKLLGPALIVVLGAVIGLLMAGLLSGVSQLGQSALK